MAEKMSDADLHSMRIRKLEKDMSDSKRLGIPMLFMQMSALSPCRPEHVARHGQLFTGQQMLEWWTQGNNTQGCRCSCKAVLVNESGEPLTPGLIARAKALLDKFHGA